MLLQLSRQKNSGLKTKNHTRTASIFALILPGLLCFPLAANLGNTPQVFASSTQTSSVDNNDPNLQQTVTENEHKAPDGQRTQITHGHIDIAPKIVTGQLILAARDDSGISPVWRSLDDMLFVLGAPAVQKLPETGYDFVGAKPGQEVWVIGQSEVPSTPWLGWSTQAPSIVEQINGPVRLTFEGHQGPGVFTNFLQSGNFGQPQVLFTSSKKTAQSIHIEPQTHTHTNWIFTAPGVHIVRLSVGATTKEGEKLSVSANLRFAIGDQNNKEEFSSIVKQAWDEQWNSGAKGKGAQVQDTQPQDSADYGQNGDQGSTGRQKSSQEKNKTQNANLWIWLSGGMGIFALICLGSVLLVNRKTKKARQMAKTKTQNIKEKQ